MIDTFGIDAMAIGDDGEIYVSLTEKNTNINYVLKWFNEQWIEAGGPTAQNRVPGGKILDLVFKNGVLYASRETDNGLYAYVNETWIEIGTLAEPVYDFGVNDINNIYVVTGPSVKKWNGLTWTDITPAVGQYEFAAIDETGRFYVVNKLLGSNGFLYYDSGLWIQLPPAPVYGSDVSGIYTHDNEVYIAGKRPSSSSSTVVYFDGVDWEEQGNLPGAFPFTIGFDISSFYVDQKGNYVTFFNAGPNNKILKWNGVQWASIGDNLVSSNVVGGIGYVKDFVRDADGYLLAAGYITSCDGSVSGNIARYNFLEDDMLEPPPNTYSSKVYPLDFIEKVDSSYLNMTFDTETSKVSSIIYPIVSIDSVDAEPLLMELTPGFIPTNESTMVYPIEIIENADGSTVFGIETIDTYDLTSSLYPSTPIVESVDSQNIVQIEQAEERAYYDFTDASVMTITGGSLAGTGFISYSVTFDATDASTMSITGGTLLPIVFHSHTTDPEKVDAGTMSVTGGLLDEILVTMPTQPSEKLDSSSLSITGGSLT